MMTDLTEKRFTTLKEVEMYFPFSKWLPGTRLLMPLNADGWEDIKYDVYILNAYHDPKTKEIYYKFDEVK